MIGAQVLFEMGADIAARNDENLGFLEIYGANIHNNHPFDDEGEFLGWFLSKEEDQKKMMQYMENKEKLIDFFPDVTLGWIAKQDKEKMDSNLPKAKSTKLLIRL